MQTFIKDIESVHDPVSVKWRVADRRIAPYIKWGGIICLIINLIITVAAVFYFVDYYDHYSDFDITLFGFQFSFEEENFFVSPFMLACYIGCFLDGIVFLVNIIIYVVSTNLDMRAKMLDNTYQTLLLTKEMAITLLPQNNDQPPTAAAQSVQKKIPVGMCEQCERSSVLVRHCKIEDHTGVRYRKICEDCMKRYNATVL